MAMVHPVYRIFSTSGSFAPTILRWLLAVVFCVHSGQKTLGWMGGPGWSATLAQWTDPHGLDLSYALAALGILAELAGAVGMLLGLITRVAALALICVMATAIATVHWQAGFLAQKGGYEYPLSLGVVAFSLLLTGGGKFSLDRQITRRLLPPNTRLLGSYRHYATVML